MIAEKNIVIKGKFNLIKDAYGKQIRIFESKIPVSVKVGESNFNSKSIIEYQPKNNVAIAYNEFVKEYVANER